jgi:iron complex outermembrane recepter protein
MGRRLRKRQLWFLPVLAALGAVVILTPTGSSQQPETVASSSLGFGLTPPPSGEAGGSRLGFQITPQAGGAMAPAAPSSQTQSIISTPDAQSASGQQALFVNANDIGQLLNRASTITGVQPQQRNAVVSDPRVRGYHVGQYVTYGDGGFFFPARQDLDTALNKFDPGSVNQVYVLKGPYSVRFGPGFAFIDIETYDAPITTSGHNEFHTRTFLGYQTNGRRWDSLESVGFGTPDWGIRATYDIRTGQDYTAGNGLPVPSEYNSQNGNFAAGYKISDNSSIQFKGLRLYQHDVEFPGLFFDINRLDTEAYSVRYNWREPDLGASFTADSWYNYTAANGDTHRGAKQAFLNPFLGAALASPVTGLPAVVQDFSNTNFDLLSSGYRFTLGWGKKDTVQVAVGTDLSLVRQRLAENIRIRNIAGVDPSIGPNTNDLGDPFLTQNLGIPQSQLLDPGFFLDTTVPFTERLTGKAGFRADFVRTTSHRQIINGNFIIIPGTVNVPGIPIVPGQPPTPEQTQVDPLVYSVNPNDTNLDRHFDLWSAYVNAEYKIDEHLTANAGFGFAERPPTLTELYAAGPFIDVLQQGQSRLVGDPHLKYERLKQLDVGLRGDYDFVRFGANGFYAWIDNYITFDLNRSIGTNLSQVVFTNTDLATLAGGELYAEVDVLSWLTPFINVSYVQGEDLTHVDTKRPGLVSARRFPNLGSAQGLGSETEPLPNIPPLELRSGVRLHEPGRTPKYAVEFLARSVMGQNDVATSLNEIKTPGFTIFDLRAFWQVREFLLVSGGVENIGDKFYREHLDPVAGSQLFRPGTNFYFTAQVTY